MSLLLCPTVGGAMRRSLRFATSSSRADLAVAMKQAVDPSLAGRDMSDVQSLKGSLQYTTVYRPRDLLEHTKRRWSERAAKPRDRGTLVSTRYVLSTNLENINIEELLSTLIKIADSQFMTDPVTASFVVDTLRLLAKDTTRYTPFGLGVFSLSGALNVISLSRSDDPSQEQRRAAHLAFRAYMTGVIERVCSDPSVMARLPCASCVHILLGMATAGTTHKMVRSKLYDKILRGTSTREYTLDAFLMMAMIHASTGDVPEQVLLRMAGASDLWDNDAVLLRGPDMLYYAMMCNLDLPAALLRKVEYLLWRNTPGETRRLTFGKRADEMHRWGQSKLAAAMYHYRLDRRELVEKVADDCLKSLRAVTRRRTADAAVVYCSLSLLRPDMHFSALLHHILSLTNVLSLDSAVHILHATRTGTDADDLARLVLIYEKAVDALRNDMRYPHTSLLCRALRALARHGGRDAFESAVATTEEALVICPFQPDAGALRDLAFALRHMRLHHKLVDLIQTTETENLDPDSTLAMMDVLSSLDPDSSLVSSLLLGLSRSTASPTQVLDGWAAACDLRCAPDAQVVQQLCLLLRPAAHSLSPEKLCQLVQCCSRSALPMPHIARRLLKMSVDKLRRRVQDLSVQQKSTLKWSLESLGVGVVFVRELEESALS